MDLASAKVIGAGLAAIGVGAAAIGVGNVFGSFLESAIRNPAAADGQQGRLFIGFAAAELLGLIAFAVAMIILYAHLTGIGDGSARGRPPEGHQCLRSISSRCVAYSQFFWLLLVLAPDLFRHRQGDAAEDPVDRRRARQAHRRRSRRRAGGARPRPTRPRPPIAPGSTRAAPRR